MEFELTEDSMGKNLVMFDDNGVASAVPFDPANSDYQAYLASLEEGEPKAE